MEILGQYLLSIKHGGLYRDLHVLNDGAKWNRLPCLKIMTTPIKIRLVLICVNFCFFALFFDFIQ